MTPAQVSDAVLAAVAAAIAAGELVVEPPPTATIDRSKNRAHGDYATNIALQLAKGAGRPPREIAEIIAVRLRQTPGVAAVDVAGPGFLNVTLDAAAQGDLARLIVEQGPRYGNNPTLAGRRINLEFVSANPTGPMHIGGTRWAAVGDSLGRILTACGAFVGREYYFNDHGAQIDRFARSLVARALGESAPVDGYGGEYITEIADHVRALVPGVMELPPDERQEVFRREGVELMFAEIKKSLHAFGVDFDVYFHENDLHDSGAVDHAIERLRSLGHIYEADGAIWLRTTTFGDDKDRVVIKSDGEPAYIAGDLAYYLNKRERGFDQVVIMLGADHHGYIGRLMAMCECFGDTPHVNLEILIGQLVNLVKDGAPVRMSKRAGNVLTMEDLVEAVGVDAARYALARSSTNSTLDVDLDLLGRKTNDNPVFYVQYAHARISSVLRNAAELGIDHGDLEPSALSHEREGDLLGVLGEFPRVVASAADLREPHRVARYLEELAGVYHRFYDACRVLPQGDDPVTDVTRARLWLCDATRVVLANGLTLLGVSAPDRM